ncbi:ISC system 2Fe-2S type ferredoxin [Enterobacteriaceae bacterium ET-AT1-13]|nr:ISC system 2Fe-2S type ferredoxin [Enterobacteriaceae bacterium ET-AT1-13]WGS66374.1 ISC system 2Fe-2S type ferredoxin [Enterobacteriaceae bacterium Cmel17]WMC17400.1 MAG: ISC system 2Fe-2S type ferredoxin [Enterobacteriaceae bacterium Cmel21]WMC17606.1 MAG: ISC system 2Fe-2S type ferredoxin [Enterobacteriaceae bacterium PSmelAO3-2]WMC17811.1 MAG: ISC system 2Fe-2S type ferredoxin [Enterobacteriaceae bacterium PSmelAO3-1]WMC18014.1 MAG: ISC system 2Fe-2S type ferredoxin [Enterobacteriaceae 
MPKIFFLPHKKICPNGLIIESKKNENLLDIAHRNNIKIENACKKSCICTTCHCIIHKGSNSLSNIKENEDNILNKAWGLEIKSRLSCQIKINNRDLVIEIPMYNINYINEY